MPNLLKFKRGLAATIPTASLAEPLFTTDTYDLYIGNGTGNTRFQKYIASGTTSQYLRGDGSLATHDLDSLTDVVITSATSGQVLKYDGTNWINGTDTDTGITSLNGLTALTQTFAVGTSGTDFAISSLTSTHTFNLPTASATNRGALSSADWSTFNSKEPAITAGTTLQYFRGDKTFQTLNTSVVPESGAIYFTEPRVLATVLTGLNLAGGGTIAATDSILTAFGKVQNQISALVGGATYQGVWNASTNSPTLASGTGTKGFYYVVSVAGSTNLDGITDWKVGDWAIFNGTTWDKVDNTDAVSSVNGFTGAVNLGLGDISNVTLTSPTNGQLLQFNGTTSKWVNSNYTYTGTVTSVGLSMPNIFTVTNSPVTSSGTLTATLATQSANTVFAGPTTGSAAAPTFRSLVAADIPTGNLTESTSSVLTITGGTGSVVGSGTSIEVKSASATQNGIVTTGTQTFAGAKTFSSDLNVNGLIVGRGAGNDSTNTVFGSGALNANTGSFVAGNTAIGYAAMYSTVASATVGYGNTALGYAALYTNSTGQSNTAIGLESAKSINGSYNTIIGRESFHEATSGSNNTIIGYQAGYNYTSGSNNTIIGGYVGTAAAISGNVIISDGSGNIRFQHNGTNGQLPFLTSNGFVKTSGSNGTLSIDTTSYLPLTGGTLTGALSGTSATFSSTISLNDDFTLNSANPQIKWASGNLRFTSVAGGADRLVLTSAGAATFSTNLSTSSPVLSVSNAGTYGMIGISRGTQTSASAGINYYTTTVQKWFTGIYENTDNFGFYSVGTAGFPLTLNYSTGAATFSSSVTATGASLKSSGALNMYVTDNSNYSYIQNSGATSGTNNLGFYVSGASPDLFIKANGNVGIGTSSPAAKLTLQQGADSLTNGFRIYRANGTDYQELYMTSGLGTLNDPINFYSSFSAGIVAAIDRAGQAYFKSNVGIGTSSPSVAGSGYIGIDIRGTNGGSVVLGTTSTIYGYLYAGSAGFRLQSDNNAPLLFITANEAMKITSGGVVLVANSSGTQPTIVGSERMNINGTIYATGFFESSSVVNKNIIETNPLSALNIDVIKYIRKNDDTNDIRYGYSAEQIHSLMPELTDKKASAVKYLDVHTLLIAQLQKRISELESKLAN